MDRDVRIGLYFSSDRTKKSYTIGKSHPFLVFLICCSRFHMNLRDPYKQERSHSKINLFKSNHLRELLGARGQGSDLSHTLTINRTDIFSFYTSN